MRLRLKIVYLFTWHIFKAKKWWFKFSLGFWRQFFGYPKLCDWPGFFFFFRKRCYRTHVRVVSMYTYFWGLYFFIIKRHYGIENLNFCLKLVRWFAAIHTTTTLPSDFCTVSKILICFSLIKHFPNDYERYSILHGVTPIKVFLP